MRYEVGEKVKLKELKSLGNFAGCEVVIGKKNKGAQTYISADEEGNFEVAFTDKDINHIKSLRVNGIYCNERTLNHYSGEPEKIGAAKNKIHQGGAGETKRTTSKFERHKELTDYMHQTYIRKNKDYGDSFEQTHNKYGAVAGLVRIADKFHRIENIILNESAVQVDDESVEDTLVDLANYSLLLAMELEDE